MLIILVLNRKLSLVLSFGLLDQFNLNYCFCFSGSCRFIQLVFAILNADWIQLVSWSHRKLNLLISANGICILYETEIFDGDWAAFLVFWRKALLVDCIYIFILKTWLGFQIMFTGIFGTGTFSRKVKVTPRLTGLITQQLTTLRVFTFQKILQIQSLVLLVLLVI